MLLTISNKTCQTKPTKPGLFFGKQNTPNRIKFKSGNFNLQTLETIVSSGYVLAYQCIDDDAMNRKAGYIGTQYIIVDVDEVDMNINELLNYVDVKPTIIHTSFSNLTEAKNNLYCFHLIYCFDSTIYGEANFYKALAYVTSGYEHLVDDNAKDCHRIAFTSHSSLPNFQLINTGIIYHVDDVLCTNTSSTEDELDSFFDDEEVSTSSTIKQEEYKDTGAFTLDSTFVHDMFTLQRGEFVNRYAREYPYITESIVPESMFSNGYADLRNYNYYQVPSSKYSWDSTQNKSIIKKITNGHRTTMLWLDAHAFCQILKDDITNEYLVYLLTKTVYEHYDNGDGQLSNNFIINKASEVIHAFKNGTVPTGLIIKKSFKIDKTYWFIRGVEDVHQMTANIIKMMHSNTYGELYDFNLTLEDNVKEFEKYGIKTKKQTLERWLKSNGLNYVTNKEYKIQMIQYYYNEDNTRSVRTIQKLLKDNNGLSTSKDTIAEVINSL